MIDLDVLETIDESFELYCQFGLLLVSGRLSYLDWNVCVRRLGIHHYVFPNDRALVEVLLDEIYNRHKKTAVMLRWHALLVGHLEAHFTEAHQIRILHLLMATPLHKVKSSA